MAFYELRFGAGQPAKALNRCAGAHNGNKPMLKVRGSIAVFQPK